MIPRQQQHGTSCVAVLSALLFLVALLLPRLRYGSDALRRDVVAVAARAPHAQGAATAALAAAATTHSRSESRTRSPSPTRPLLPPGAAPPAPSDEGGDYYAAYGESGPGQVPVPVPGEEEPDAPEATGSDGGGSRGDEAAAGGTPSAGAVEEAGDAAAGAAASSEPQPLQFHTQACVPLAPTAGAAFDAWPVHPRDKQGGVPRFSRDVTGLNISAFWSVSLCYVPVGRPVRALEPGLAGLRAIGMAGVVVVTRAGERPAGKRHRGQGKELLSGLSSACDARREYALPLPWADTYDSLRLSSSPRVMRYGRLVAGPDEVSVELEGPELLALEPTFDPFTCSYSFHFGLTLPGRYRLRVMAFRGGYAGLTESHRKYPETSFDNVLGDAAFLLAVDASADGWAAEAHPTSAGEPPASSSPLLEVNSSGLDAAWRRATGRVAGAAAAALPVCHSATAPAGRWVASAPPSAVQLPPHSQPLRLPRLASGRSEYVRPWWTKPGQYSWLAYGCRQPPPPPLREVRACFAARRVLIAGDSHDRALFSLLVGHLWGISHVGVVPKTFTGTRCFRVPGSAAPWDVVGAVALVPSPLELDGAAARANASLAQPLPPQLCFAWNHLPDAAPLRLLDGRWDVVLFGFGHHPANGVNRWTLDRWRSAVSRVARSVVSASALLDARARHEADALAAAANGTAAAGSSAARLWRESRVIWHTIPAPPVRKDGQPRKYGDGRTLQRLRAMNELALEALDDAGGTGLPALATMDLWAMTLPLLDLAADAVHYDSHKPFADAVVAALVGAVCGPGTPASSDVDKRGAER